MKVKFLAVLIASTVTSVVFASPLHISYDNFNYRGTVTRYSSLSDAQSGVNALSQTSIATATNGSSSTLNNARDGAIYVASSTPSAYATANQSAFYTAWYFINPSTTAPNNTTNGFGNPNNSNNGFVQYVETATVPSTTTGGWSNSYQTFSLGLSGGAGDSNNAARLWAAPSSGGPSSDTRGIFRSFNLNLVADFLNSATLNTGTGWYETLQNPTSILGSATGIFENDSVNTSLNGFYSFNFAFAPGSWAQNVGATWLSNPTTSVSTNAFFAAPKISSVPTPSSILLLGLAALGLLATRIRQNSWYL
jgi:hypothetical protein